MRLKLYWLHKLRAFKTRAFRKKNRSIAAVSDHNVNKDNAINNTSTLLSQDSSHIKRPFIAASSFEKTPLKHRKPSSRISQVVASLGCGSTVPLRLRKERHKPKVYCEEDRLQAPPLATFGGIDKGFMKQGQHAQHVEDDYFFKEGCLDPHATTKRWVGACRCMQDVATVDKGSTRSDEALLSKKLRKELRSHDGQAKATESSTESKLQSKGSMSKNVDRSLVQNAVVRELHLVSESKRNPFTKVEGSMSDRIVVDQTRVNAEAKILKRWSSASVRDYTNMKGNSTPGDSISERSIGSISYTKERSLQTNCDEHIRKASFERRRPQSMTSVSTLSSYDFDRASHWESYDVANVPWNTTNAGHSWQGNIVEESNVHYKTSQRPAFSTRDPNASVKVYAPLDPEDNEEEHGLLHTVSYARAWLNRNVYADDDDEDNDDDDDDEYADCLIDLEANAKAWATAWALSSSDVMRLNSSSYKGSSSRKHDYVNSAINSHRSQRELDAAALKRKYHKEFAGKQQAIVVSSHYEDDMNTFMFPSMSDHEDETGANPSKIFDCAGRSYHGLAVEKKSQNPYADFRDSMVDMVLQKQMYKSSDLEELLQSFLCLNSLEHHDLIVQAFSEVWEKVFGSINGFHKRP